MRFYGGEHSEECYEPKRKRSREIQYRPTRLWFMEPLPWLPRKRVVETTRPSDEEWAAFCAQVEGE
jgi:hypothetical protein